jgi:hypothetical protein
MMDSLRRAIIALTLLVLGGGHAACACAAVAQAVSVPEVAAAALASHDVHAVSDDAPDADHCDTGSEDESHDCTGCDAVALPADSSIKAAGAFPADFAALPAIPGNGTSGVFKLATLRIEPARGPPRPSPSLVTLKIRLQN